MKKIAVVTDSNSGITQEEFYEKLKGDADIAHTHNESEALKFRDEVEAAFPGYEVGFVDPLSLSVSCHIGDGALALAITEK